MRNFAKMHLEMIFFTPRIEYNAKIILINRVIYFSLISKRYAKYELQNKYEKMYENFSSN